MVALIALVKVPVPVPDLLQESPVILVALRAKDGSEAPIATDLVEELICQPVEHQAVSELS